MQTINGVRKKQPGRVVVAPDAKLLVSREEAAQLLSISQGAAWINLIANRRLPTRRIGGRIPNSGSRSTQVRTRRSS